MTERDDNELHDVTIEVTVRVTHKPTTYAFEGQQLCDHTERTTRCSLLAGFVPEEVRQVADRVISHAASEITHEISAHLNRVQQAADSAAAGVPGE